METNNLPSNSQSHAQKAGLVRRMLGIGLVVVVLLSGGISLRYMQTRDSELAGDLKLAVSPQLQLNTESLNLVATPQEEMVVNPDLQLNTESLNLNQPEVQEENKILNPDLQISAETVNTQEELQISEGFQVEGQIVSDPDLKIQSQEPVLNEPLQITPQFVEPKPIEPIGQLDNAELLAQEIVTSSIDVIPPNNIQGLPIQDKGKVSLWVAAGQGMKLNDNKLIQWTDLSGKGNHLVANSTYAPQITKEFGANCSEFNCQYIPSFDGQNDYMKSSKKVDRVKEMFVVVDMGDAMFNQNSGAKGNIFTLGQLAWHSKENDRRAGLRASFTQEGVDYFHFDYHTDYLMSCPDDQDPCGDVSTLTRAATGANKNVAPHQLKYPFLVHLKLKDIGIQPGSEMRINGSEDISGIFQFHYPMMNSDFVLGGQLESVTSLDKNGPARFFQGKVGEVILLNDSISNNEREQIESYLTTKFGISNGNPHPFPYTPATQTYVTLSNAKVAEFNPGYAYGIVGVARQESLGLNVGAGSNNFSTSTQHQNFLSMGQAVNMKNGEFIYAGHNQSPENADAWSNQTTKEGFNLLTRKWQVSGKVLEEGQTGLESLVMSFKLTPNASSKMIQNDKMTLKTPAANEDYAIAVFDQQNFTGSPKKYLLLKDSGSEGDLVANDNIYSARLSIDDINRGNAYFTVVKGGKGDFDDKPLVPVDNIDVNPIIVNFGYVEFRVRAKNQKGTTLNEGFAQVSYKGLPWVSTPYDFKDQSLLTLVDETNFLFGSTDDGYTVPDTLTVQNQMISSMPDNIKVYKVQKNFPNDLLVPYTLGEKFQVGDVFIIDATYIDNVVDFEVRTQDNQQNPASLNEKVSYNYQPSVPTPYQFSENIENLAAAKSLTFDAKDGYIKPAPIVIQNKKITIIPQRVKIYKNEVSEQNLYPAGEIIDPTNKMIVVGTYNLSEDQNADNSEDPVVIETPADNAVVFEQTLITGTCEAGLGVFITNPYFTQDPAFTVCKEDGTFSKTVFWLPNTPEGQHEIIAYQVNEFAQKTGDDSVLVNYQYPEPEEDENKIVFRILSEDEKGDLLTGSYSYSNDPYAPTPAVVLKEHTEFVNLTKNISFGPKDGYVTPGSPNGVVIENTVINELPKNVKLYLNAPNAEYPLGTPLQKEDTLFIVGIYVKKATITVGVNGPEDLDQVPVDIPGVAEDEPINNGEKKDFEVDPDGNYEVICPEIDGYVLITDPHPIPVNNLEPGDNEDVSCEYVHDEEENQPLVPQQQPVCGNNIVEQGEQCDDGNQFTESCAYGLLNCTVCSATCQQVQGTVTGYCGDNVLNFNHGEQCDDGNLINGDGCSSACKVEAPKPVVQQQPDINITNVTNIYNPAPVGPGQTNTGAIYYSADETEEFNYEAKCLAYDPNRPLSFVDAKAGDKGAKEANILKNTFLESSGLYRQYILSGYNTQANSEGESSVGLTQPITRLALAKMLLTAHCYQIFDAGSLPDKRFDGNSMPSYNDLPLDGPNTWEKDVMYSATFYRIVDGTKENNIELARPVTLAEAYKMIMRAGEFRQGYQYQRDDEAVKPLVSTNEWYFTFLSKAHKAGLLQIIPNAATRAGEPLIRNDGVKVILEAILQRDLYSDKDRAVVEGL